MTKPEKTPKPAKEGLKIKNLPKEKELSEEELKNVSGAGCGCSGMEQDPKQSKYRF